MKELQSKDVGMLEPNLHRGYEKPLIVELGEAIDITFSGRHGAYTDNAINGYKNRL
jgi:hypothetical protein